MFKLSNLYCSVFRFTIFFIIHILLLSPFSEILILIFFQFISKPINSSFYHILLWGDFLFFHLVQVYLQCWKIFMIYILYQIIPTVLSSGHQCLSPYQLRASWFFEYLVIWGSFVDILSIVLYDFESCQILSRMSFCLSRSGSSFKLQCSFFGLLPQCHFRVQILCSSIQIFPPVCLTGQSGN